MSVQSTAGMAPGVTTPFPLQMVSSKQRAAMRDGNGKGDSVQQ